ncbi:MAG: AAA family ATPase [Tepidisphaeraceae bacterium]
MKARTNITLMTPDASLAAAVSAALHANGHVVSEPPVRDLRDLAPQLGRAPVPIVLIDLDPQPQQVLPQLERIIARFPATRFIALSSTLGNDLLLEAMQTGVRRVVMKQTMGADLPGVLDRLTAPDLQSGPAGEIITVLSASGGCGATTLAINLAEEVSLKRKQPTLLCDLDCSYGAVASYLGLTPRYAADHILHNAGDIDAQLIQSTTTVHSERIHVLASPASINFANAEPLKFDRLEHALDSARRAYAVTIFDAPRLPLATTAALAAGSSSTLLVFQLTVKDLRSARAMLDALRGRGVDGDSIIAVANRYVKRQLISLEEAGKALGGVEVLAVRNDFMPAIQGLNFGQTLSEAGPRSSLRRDLQELVTKLESRTRVSA